MEEKGGKGAHHQHERQRAEGEDERGRGVRLGEGGGPAGQVAENERGAGLGGPLQGGQGGVEREDRLAQPRDREKNRGDSP